MSIDILGEIYLLKYILLSIGGFQIDKTLCNEQLLLPVLIKQETKYQIFHLTLILYSSNEEISKQDTRPDFYYRVSFTCFKICSVLCCVLSVLWSCNGYIDMNYILQPLYNLMFKFISLTFCRFCP